MGKRRQRSWGAGRLRPITGVRSRGLLPRNSPGNRLKSPVGARNLASQGIEATLFGLFWPRYNGQIHARSVTQTPFQTVSRRSSTAKGIASVRSTGHLRTVAPIYSVTGPMRTSGGFSAAYPALYLR